MIKRNMMVSALASAALLVLGTGSSPVSLAGGPVILEDDHADVGIGYVDGAWDLHVHTDVAEYEPGEVVLRARPASETMVSSNPAFSFLGAPGTPIWVLPQVENTNLLFLGLATEEIEPGVFVGDQVSVALKSVTGPGQFFLYDTDLFGSPVVRFNSADGIGAADTLLRPVQTHAHYNWTFTAPGTYEIGLEASGTLVAGNTFTSSGTVIYHFEVQAIGGKNLRIGTGSVELDWRAGNVQTGYTLLKYNTSTAAATLIALPAAASAYSDATAANGVVYCYVLAATDGSGLLGLSDLECAMTGLQSPAHAPGAFKLALNQTANASMTWTTPVGGADSYLLQRIPLDGSPITALPLPGTATSSIQAVVPAGTCFQLIAFKGAAFGTTNVLCGVPGVTTLRVDATPGKRLSATEALTDISERLSQLRLPEAAVGYNADE